MLSKLAMSEDRPGYGLKPIAGTRYDKLLKILALTSFFAMITAQTVMLMQFAGEQISDGATYLHLAKQCAENDLWYPSVEHIFTPFLFGNGLVNLVALVLRATPNLKVVFFLNMLFVQIQLWSCVYIIKKVFRRPTICFWFVILFCLLNTFWGEIVQIRTEIPFNAFAFVGLAILFSDKKWSYPTAGVLLALANWIRPIAMAFLIGAIWTIFFRSKKLRHIAGLISGYLTVILLIGSISLANCGHFVYQSTTFGYNLIMSAHDDADGSYMMVVDEGQVGYIEPDQKKDMIFKDYDEYYTNLSLEWIKENPVDYLKQIPAKLFFLYGTETYSGSAYFHNEVDTSGIKYIKSLASKFTGESNEPFYIGDILIILNQIWYMMICVLFAVSIVLLIKKKQWRGILPLWLSMLCGTGITVLVVGGARYHFPYLPTMLICAAFTCECIFAGDKKRNDK